jgi:glycosyltransferase involved in cell wall biosynthesis
LCDSGANRGRFPLKLNDYMALGKATIATDVGDMGTFVRDNHIGFVAEDSAESLAEMTQLLWHDTAARTTFEQQAIALAHTKYNWCRISTDLAHFYEDILRQ